MNILPKKNWHVRKKENIARVRRDEAEAAEKEKQILQRAKLAEQEARLTFLRNRARGNTVSCSTKDEVTDVPPDENIDTADIYTSSGNINFFKEAEMECTNTGTNKEYEKEKKAEKEDFEKKIGLLTYLGQDTYEAIGKSHWYTEKEPMISKRDKSNEDSDLEVGLKQKGKIDPLTYMMKYGGLNFYPKSQKKDNFNIESGHSNIKPDISKPKREKKKKKKKRLKMRHSDSSEQEVTSYVKRKKKKKHSKRKKLKKSLSTSSSSKSSSEESEAEEKRIKLMKMREERLKRENHEKKRQERLLAGKNPDVEDESESKAKLPYQQKYNSQFNPHLAKQNVLNNSASDHQTTLKSGVKYWLN